MIAATRSISSLPTREPKMVRVMSPICRARPKWAASSSDAVPEIFVERSITVPSTLPCFSVRGTNDLRGGTQQRNGILVEARVITAVDGHAAERCPQRRAQNQLGRDSASYLKSQRCRIDPQ